MMTTPELPEGSRRLAFQGERLQLVREFRGYTQKEMAALMGVSSAAVSDFENSKRLPSSESVAKVAFETGFLAEFFYQRGDGPFLEHECSFRHRRTTAQRTKDQVRAHASLIGMVVSALRRIFRFPELSLPSFDSATDEGIEAAAGACRDYWQLDLNAPIRQVGRVLERAGIVIIASSVDTTKIDAFSRMGSSPMVFLNRGAGTSPSRWNFDLAHELAHLVLHQHLSTGSAETEAAADKFASAFLMPRLSFATDFRARPFSWSLVFELKRRWQVSAAAIIRRARDLGLIEEVAYRRAFQYMSAKRWRAIGEPYEPAFQEPELFVDALRTIRESGESKLLDLCGDLGFSTSVFTQVTGVKLRDATSAKLLRFPY